MRAPGGTRVVASLPTLQFVPAVAVIEAVRRRITEVSKTGLDSPCTADEGRYASVLSTGRYQDLQVRSVASSGVKIGGSTFTKNIDAIRVLPDSFPGAITPRAPRTVNRKVVETWDVLSNGGDGPRLHAKVSAHPIVIIGGTEQFRDDLTLLSERLWPNTATMLDVSFDIEDWFRHPVMALGYGSATKPWLFSLQPALVIVCGVAAWRSAIRRAFSGSPQLWFVDRTSRVTLDAVDELMLTDPTQMVVKLPAFGGVELFAFEERDGLLPRDGEDEF